MVASWMLCSITCSAASLAGNFDQFRRVASVAIHAVRDHPVQVSVEIGH